MTPTTPTADGDGAVSTLEGASQRSATFERVLRTAAELFAENGYHATGIAELSKEVELSRGALYHYIDSKETLLYEISKAQVELLTSEAAEIVALDSPAEERVRLLARTLIRNISDHLSEWTVFFREFGALSSNRLDQIVAARDEYENYWLQLLKEWSEEGGIREPSPVLLKGILGLFNYTYLWYRPDGPQTPEQIADEFFYLLADGLRGPRPE